MLVEVLVERRRTGKVGEVIDFPNNLVEGYEKKGLIKRKGKKEDERHVDDQADPEC